MTDTNCHYEMNDDTDHVVAGARECREMLTENTTDTAETHTKFDEDLFNTRLMKDSSDKTHTLEAKDEKRNGERETVLGFGIDFILRDTDHDYKHSSEDTTKHHTYDVNQNLTNTLNNKANNNEGDLIVNSDTIDNDEAFMADVEEDTTTDKDHDNKVDLDNKDKDHVGGSMIQIQSPVGAYLGLEAKHWRMGTQGSLFPPSLPLGPCGMPWSVVQEIRRDRFGLIRRVGHPYQNRTPPKRKKPRTSFTRIQIMELEKRFERQKYLASTERSTLAKSLKMTDAQVKTWFQNRRTKWRRQTAEEREMERQAANRLLLSLQSDTAQRKSLLISPDRMCLSRLQRWPDARQSDA